MQGSEQFGISHLVQTKFSDKLIFLTPCMHTCVYQGVRNVSFSENVACILNDDPFRCLCSGVFIVNFHSHSTLIDYTCC